MKRSLSRRMAPVAALPALGFVGLLFAACAGTDAPAAWTTARTQAGDTAVVRTENAADTAGSRTLVREFSIGQSDAGDDYLFASIAEVERAPDASLWIFDSQIRSLRQFDSSGKFVRTIGRKGSGPGEYERANGLAILPNGNAILWDAGSARVRVYSSSGEPLADWVVPGSGGFSTSNAVFGDTAGFGYVKSRVGDPPAGDDPSRGFMFGITGLLRYAPDGSITDSLVPPSTGLQPVFLVATSEGGSSANGIPFTAREVWTWSQLGYFVSARGDRYAVNLHHTDGKVTRIERAINPVVVDAGERADAIDNTTLNMRMTDPNWKWNGPPVPDQKPFVRGLIVDEDARIWVQVSATGELIPEDERPTRVPPEGGEPKPYGPKYRERPVYDVFSPDGIFLARVPLPWRTNIRIMKGDHIWAITRDENDVQQLTRFRIEPPLTAALR